MREDVGNVEVDLSLHTGDGSGGGYTGYLTPIGPNYLCGDIDMYIP